MDVFRTPDHCFANLPDFPFVPHYLAVPDGDGGDLRVHYLDEGPSTGPVVLLLHGEPTWAYLYRKMVPVLVDAGFRCVVPDQVGFGRSDKPLDQAAYTYASHVAWMGGVVDTLGLDGVTLFGQDWGGLVGLRVLSERPDRFARIAVANTGLPTGEHRPTDAFLSWQRYAAGAETLPIGQLIAGGCATRPGDDVIAAYDAPYPDEASKAGARVFPSLVPTSPDDPGGVANRAAWEVLKVWEKPLLTLFSDSDPITRGGERPFQTLVPGAQGQPHRAIEGAAHFLQEDKGEVIAEALVDWIGRL